MGKQKILYLVEAFGGGVYTYMQSLANRLCDEYDIVIAYSMRPQTPLDFKKYFNENIKFIEVKNFTRSIGKKDLSAVLEVRKIVKEEKPDIVHVHSSKAGIIGRLAITDKKIKMFYTPHGYSFLKQDDSKLKRSFYKYTEKMAAMYKRDCTTIACSYGEYKEGLKIYKNCDYVNNGIDMKEIDSVKLEKNDGNKIRVCTVGRIDIQKNPELFNKIAEKFPNVDFVWIGDGWKKDLLTSSNIQITGWKTRQETLQEVAKCDIFLLPSIWEGLPMSLLEAMYLEKPCVVSNISGNNNVIKNGINGFICDDLTNYYDAINNIILKKCNTEEICMNAKKSIINEFNIDSMSRKYSEVYKRYSLQGEEKQNEENRDSIVLF